MLAFVFPGQGAQKIGMGKELADNFNSAKQVFEEADEALGEHLSRMCYEGPEEELKLTANSQPAILTMSIAALRALEAETGLTPAIVAGHSLGEYSALVCAGVLSLADAVRTVRKRGKFMQEAVPAGQGGMAAVMGIGTEAAEALCRKAAQGQVLSPANYNSANQVVIAGHAEAVERSVTLGEAEGAMVKRLVVSAPFHCTLMEGAAVALEPELQRVTFADARIPVVSNVDAQARQAAAEIRTSLVRQVTAPVRWQMSVVKMAELGTTHIIELGPGRVLSGLIRRIDKKLKLGNVEDLKSLTKIRSRLEDDLKPFVGAGPTPVAT